MHAGLQATPLDHLGMRDNEISLYTAVLADDDPKYDADAKESKRDGSTVWTKSA
jgi:hypothetical protein